MELKDLSTIPTVDLVLELDRRGARAWSYAVSIQTLTRLGPGDVILAKLGDPVSGSVPSQEAADRFVKLLRGALESVGKDTQVVAVVWDYLLNVEVYRTSA